MIGSRKERAAKLSRAMSDARHTYLRVKVASIKSVALAVRTFELVAVEGDALPSFSPGAHITILLPGGLRRQYSLAGDIRDTSRYLIAVLRQGDGSQHMHDRVAVGSVLEIAPPQNHFPLVEGPGPFVLMAGGIGITPIVSMAQALAHRGAEFTLHYCARSRDQAAFVEHLSSICSKSQLSLYFDGGDPTMGLQVDRLIGACVRGTHVYCCGPGNLMKAVRDATASWPSDTVHFEYFAPSSPMRPADGGGFEVTLRRRGMRLIIPTGKSIVEVLRAHGIDVETSCEVGTCGTCRTRYFSGEPIHNDFVLTEVEKAQYVMICCAQNRGAPLELDL